MQAAMDNAVAERRQSPIPELLSHPLQDRRQCLARHRRRFRAQIRRWDDFAIGSNGLCGGMYTDPIELSGKDLPLALVDAELD